MQTRNKTKRKPKSSRTRNRRIFRKPANTLDFQALEDRRLLATFTVSSLNDAGPDSLREAITTANSTTEVDTILFFIAGSIELDSQLPNITEALTIDGDSQITLDAGNGVDGFFGTGDGFCIFNIGDNTPALIDVTLRGLTLTGGDIGHDEFGFGQSGGAIFSVENLELIDSTVTRSSAGGGFDGFNGLDGFDGGDGGGIWSAGTLTLINSTVSRNVAGDGGNGSRNLNFGYYSDGGGGGDGAGIFSTGMLSVINSTMSGNVTGYGGYGANGIYGYGGSGGGIWSSAGVSILQSTVTGNQANGLDSTGGGIWNNNDAAAIRSSIVAGNVAIGDSDIRSGTGVLNVNYSLIQQTGLPITGSGNIFGVSAQLGPLTSNGGPTQTHSLLAVSPAIDAGDPAIVANPLLADQRGAPFVRVFDDPDKFGAGIDIGAFERQSVPEGGIVVDIDSDVFNGDLTTGDLSLREAVLLANISAGSDSITFASSLAGATITPLAN